MEELIVDTGGAGAVVDVEVSEDWDGESIGLTKRRERLD